MATIKKKPSRAGMTKAKTKVKVKAKSSPSRIRVIELFAGVGGFRVGLENANRKLKSARFDVIWSNQWEPSTKRQHATEVYLHRWPKANHNGDDINVAIAKGRVPQDFELAVGGFPCQDYSVARTANQAAGIEGKKGVLWWSIHKIMKNCKPPYGLFENVDRLLKSPTKQRGRDFAVMLASMAELGYVVEWRVINAAEYGFSQRRKRIFILAYRSQSKLGIAAKKNGVDWITKRGVFARAFPCTPFSGTGPVQPELAGAALPNFSLTGSLADISEEFNKSGQQRTPFHDAGLLVGRDVFTIKTLPVYSGPRQVLGHVLQPEREVPEGFYVSESDLAKWTYLKGGKNATRKKADGVEYTYSEGPIAFPDPLDRPSRTIITGEGGSTPSRFKHIIQLPDDRWRRLTPVELERLSGFPPDHTLGPDISDAKRAFFIGNALVTGVVTRIGRELAKRLK
jgi:DNA (cytosine-5)-methyltransferase 1